MLRSSERRKTGAYRRVKALKRAIIKLEQALDGHKSLRFLELYPHPIPSHSVELRSSAVLSWRWKPPAWGFRRPWRLVRCGQLVDWAEREEMWEDGGLFESCEVGFDCLGRGA
jgi:hypothetical protein